MTLHPKDYRPENVTVEITQVGRWHWKASVRCGLMQWGEFGGPYAFTRKRCIKKAQRRARKWRQCIAWQLASEAVAS